MLHCCLLNVAYKFEKSYGPLFAPQRSENVFCGYFRVFIRTFSGRFKSRFMYFMTYSLSLFPFHILLFADTPSSARQPNVKIFLQCFDFQSVSTVGWNLTLVFVCFMCLLTWQLALEKLSRSCKWIYCFFHTLTCTNTLAWNLLLQMIIKF